MAPLFRYTIILILLMTGNMVAAENYSKPEEQLEHCFKYFETKGITAMADCIHPQELAKVKRTLLPHLEKDFQKDPKAIGKLFGKRHWSQIQNMPDVEFVRYLLLNAQGEIAAIQYKGVQIIGRVVEGKIIHVLARVSMQARGVSFEQLDIYSFIPNGSSWAMLLPEKFKMLLQLLKDKERQ